MSDSQQLADTSFLEKSIADQPPNTYIAITNVASGPLFTWVVLPNSGKLWVFYEWGMGGPLAKEIYIWHQGGQRTPINPGPGEYQVGATDALAWVLNSPQDAIKVGCVYV